MEIENYPTNLHLQYQKDSGQYAIVPYPDSIEYIRFDEVDDMIEDAVANVEKRMPQWHDRYKETPPQGEYIVQTYAGDMYTAHCSDVGEWWCPYAHGWGSSRIIAWMELPKPFKKN